MSVFKNWSCFMMLICNLILVLDILPRMVNAQHTELVLLAPVVLGIIVTADYYILKMLFKKGEIKLIL